MSNVCERCGGQKTFWFTVNAMPEGQPSLAVSDASFTLCLCPPAREKHDGKLGDGQYSTLQVNYDEVHDAEKQRYIEGIHIADAYGYAPLTPKQALSLLAWLKQEEATLEQLVQAEDK